MTTMGFYICKNYQKVFGWFIYITSERTFSYLDLVKIAKRKLNCKTQLLIMLLCKISNWKPNFKKLKGNIWNCTEILSYIFYVLNSYKLHGIVILNSSKRKLIKRKKQYIQFIILYFRLQVSSGWQIRVRFCAFWKKSDPKGWIRIQTNGQIRIQSERN